MKKRRKNVARTYIIIHNFMSYKLCKRNYSNRRLVQIYIKGNGDCQNLLYSHCVTGTDFYTSFILIQNQEGDIQFHYLYLDIVLYTKLIKNIEYPFQNQEGCIFKTEFCQQNRKNFEI